VPTCTKAKFDVWNEDEVKFTGAYQCFKCFLEVFLDEIGTNAKNPNKFDTFGTFDNTQRGPGFGWEKFTYFGLDTYVARLRVQGIASTVCDGKIRGCGSTKTVNTPLLGVLLYAQEFGLPASNSNNVGLIPPCGIINSNNAKIVDPLLGTTLHGAGLDAGFVLWDPAQSVVPEAPAQ
jgi:hypothetical protein